MKTLVLAAIVALLFATGVLKTTIVTVDTTPITNAAHKAKVKAKFLRCYQVAYDQHNKTHELPAQADARCQAESVR